MKYYWQCLAFILFLWLFSVEGSFKSAKFVKRNVTSRTYLKSKIRAESLVGCAGWCINSDKCDGFKLLGKNCTLYSNIFLYYPTLVSLFDNHVVIDELRIPHGNPKFYWVNFTHLNSSKALMIGGEGPFSKHGKVVDLNTGKECPSSLGQLSSESLYAPAIGIVEDKFIIVCGGFQLTGSSRNDKTECEVIDGKSKNVKIAIDANRFANAIQWSNSALWLTGHKDNKSTIIVTRKGYIPGPDMPDIRYGHCGLRINVTTAIIISGSIKQKPLNGVLYTGLSGQSTKATWYFDFPTQTWNEGPPVEGATRLGQFSCAIFRLDDKPQIILANGKNEYYQDGVEQVQLLDLGSNSWRLFARTRYYHSMKGTSLFAMGQKLFRYGGDKNPNALFTLDCGVKDCQNYNDCHDLWMMTRDVLSSKRYHSGSTLVPETLVKNC